MIKSISVSAIQIYQIFISTLLKNLTGVNTMCRFDVSCSEYTKRAILDKGFIKGTQLGFIRILKCQPFTS